MGSLTRKHRLLRCFGCHSLCQIRPAPLHPAFPLQSLPRCFPICTNIDLSLRRLMLSSGRSPVVLHQRHVVGSVRHPSCAKCVLTAFHSSASVWPRSNTCPHTPALWEQLAPPVRPAALHQPTAGLVCWESALRHADDTTLVRCIGRGHWGIHGVTRRPSERVE